MATKTFDRDVLYEILDLEDDIVRDTITKHSRWSVVHELIFKYKGKLYRTEYSVGATETQDEAPWHWSDKVKCEEVHPVERTVVEYEP